MVFGWFAEKSGGMMGLEEMLARHDFSKDCAIVGKYLVRLVVRWMMMKELMG